MVSDRPTDNCMIRVTADSCEKRGGLKEEMMKKAISVTFLLPVVALAVALACPVTVSCPIRDGSEASLTGTRFVDGVLMGVYHCPRGHDVMARCN
jgi:hypothetical protein